MPDYYYSIFSGTILLLRIFIADMGYAYGHLLADEIRDSYYSLLYSLLGGKTVESEIIIEVLGLALDWQWKDYLVSFHTRLWLSQSFTE